MDRDQHGWPPLSPAHFLVVEDDPVIGRAVGRAADGLLPARLAKTGTEALAALLDRPLPRFVLLDFRLPDMDGSQVLRHLRADPECRSLPVIVFSSLQDRALIERTLAEGANEWVPKPDDPRSLHGTVRDLCQRWGQPPVPVQQAPAAGPVPGSPGSPPPSPPSPPSLQAMTWSSVTTTTRTQTTTVSSGGLTTTTSTTTTTSSSNTTSAPGQGAAPSPPGNGAGHA